jgi:heme-degrading monooxygenase HmoA
MAVLMMLEVPGGTAEQYGQANEIMGIQGDDDAPDGLISHIAARTDDGFLIADVWTTEDAMQAFFEERAGAALAQAGMPQAQPRIAPVHNHIAQGAGTEANYAVIIEIDDLSPDDYDQLISGMGAVHAAGGANHPAVSHLAAVTDDGGMIVVDVWESPEAFEEFATTTIAPAGEAVGLGAMETRVLPVHNTLKGSAPAA